MINLITSLAFRNHLRNQLAEFERQHGINPKILEGIK